MSAKLYLAAAVLLFATVLIHVFAGGPEIHQTIRHSAMPAEVRAVGSVIWHVTTWVLILMTVATAWLVRDDNRALEAMVVALHLGFAVLFIGFGLFLLGSPWPMPQWTLFLGIAVLTLAARWSRRKEARAV